MGVRVVVVVVVVVVAVVVVVVVVVLVGWSWGGRGRSGDGGVGGGGGGGGLVSWWVGGAAPTRLEAKRQLEEAAWIESYLEDVVKQTAPPEFLKSWLLHTELRDDVAVLASTHRLHKGTGWRRIGRGHHLT